MDSERRLLARTHWVLTAQIAAVITGVVLVVGAVLLWLTLHTQRTNSERDLRAYAERAAVLNPPPCVWMFSQQGAVFTGTPSAPTSLPVRASLDAVAAGGGATVEQWRIDGLDYLIRTQRRGAATVQVVMDLRYQLEERDRLYLALGVSEAVGLLAALVTGRLLARRAIAPLGEALRRQRRFVADASHELRTPLTQLHTRAQLLQRRSRTDPDPDRVERELERIVGSTRQLGEIVEDLLRSAQLRQAPSRFEPVDLVAVAAEVVAADSDRARARDVRVELDGLAAPSVVGVRPALRRVVSALVDNAVAHCEPGGHVWVSVRPGDDGRVVLTVRDDGVGFEPGAASRLFDPFVHGDSGAGPRFGLGLALVREVVDSHGGTVTATGSPGQGATFTVELRAAGTAAGTSTLTAVGDRLRRLRRRPAYDD